VSRTHALGFKVTAERDAELRALAKLLGWSISELINRLIDDALPDLRKKL
jgi:hypothetical protein